MDDTQIWRRQQDLNNAHTTYLEELHKQVRLLTYGIIGTTTGLLTLTIGIILK
jgi:hypothetical protein